jgi:hypothetical protein
MITTTDTDLAKKFLPTLAAKKDIVSVNKIKSTAKVIAAAMLPERQALADLVAAIEYMVGSDEWKQFHQQAGQMNLVYRGPNVKQQFQAAKAIVDTYPQPEIEGA